MKAYSILGIAAVVVCSSGYADIVVEEHNPGSYTLGSHYYVNFLEGLPVITILQPSLPGLPYDFDCYYEGTTDPAPVRSLTAVGGIGTVEVMISPHEGRPYGASDVWLLQLNQTGVTGRVVEMKISGNYGDPTSGGPLVADSAGSLYIGGGTIETVSIGAGGAGTFHVTGDVNAAVSITGSVNQLYVGSTINADIQVGGDVGKIELVTVGVDGAVVIDGNLGPGMVSSIDFLNGRVIVDGSVTGWLWMTSLAGCCAVGQSVETNLSIISLGGTLAVVGDLLGATIDDLRPQGVIDIGGSIVDTLEFSPYMAGELHVGTDVLAPIEVGASDITGRVVVDGDLESTISTPWDLRHFPSVPPVDGGEIVIGGAVTADGSIEIGGTLDGGRIEVGELAGSVEMGDLAGVVRVGSPYANRSPMSGSIIVDGEMSGDIFVDTGFGEGAVVDVTQKSADALFVVNADGANPEQDTWDGGVFQIGETPAHEEPDESENLWWASCIKGDANGDDTLNAFDIDPFVQMLSSPGTYCAAYPGLCGGLTPTDDGSYIYRADLNCDGLVNAFDIDPFVVKLASQASWEAQYPPSCEPVDLGECCPSGGLGGMAAFGSDSPGMGAAYESAAATAALIVEHVSPARRPALLLMASELAAELTDPQRAALWEEVEAELLSE